MSRVTLRAVVGLCVLSMLLAGAAGSVGAQSDVVSVSFDTEYDGTGDGSQAVAVTATFVADAEVSNLTVNFIENDVAFIDADTFQTTSGPNVAVEPTNRDGRYLVPSLSSGQQFTITFDAYPKRLDRESMRVAAYRMNAENPQTFSEEGFVTADLSSSPYLAYQDLELFDTVGVAGVGAALLIGLLAILMALYLQFFRLPGKIDSELGWVSRELDETIGAVTDPIAEAEIEDLKERVDERRSGDDVSIDDTDGTSDIEV